MLMYKRERLDMVERLISYGFLKEGKVADAMRKVPRHLFVPDDMVVRAYEDRPLPVGEDQTISAPHMVAMMCSAMEFAQGDNVLEIGSGTGYHACVAAQIVGEVWSVERIEALAKKAEINLEKAGCKGVRVILGDGGEGYQEEAPYDRIYVTAGAPEVPAPLLDQLKPGGKLLIPLGGKHLQDLILIEKFIDGNISRRNLGGCAFVPLIGEHGWPE